MTLAFDSLILKRMMTIEYSHHISLDLCTVGRTYNSVTISSVQGKNLPPKSGVSYVEH